MRTEETIEQWLQNLYSNKPRFTKKFSSRFYKLKHGKIVPCIAASTECVRASFFETPEFLPISLSKQIARTYGTRHRAAIGITEATDGICLVVSEERGTVAMVQLGEIVPVADANELRQLLTEELERSASKLKADAPAPGATHAS